jgi:HK97 family phage major capsid protein
MDQRDATRFNITAGIRAALSGDWSSYEAGLVREMSAEVQKSMGRGPSAERAFFIPFSALTRATYVTSGATTGGNLVQTDLLDQDFIEFLRNRSVMLAAGVRTMPGLQGNVAIPRRSGVASTYYLSTQTTAITQSESTFDQVTLSPKNLAALSKYSRQTLLQATPGIEQLVRTDLIDGINVAMDLGILNGSGASGQPTGIMGTSGIGSVAIGTNGGAITMNALVDLETELSVDNVPLDRNTVSYITNAKVMGNLKKLRAGGSTTTDGPFLVNDNLVAIGRGGTPSVVNGYPIYVTNQVPSNLQGHQLRCLLGGGDRRLQPGHGGPVGQWPRDHRGRGQRRLLQSAHQRPGHRVLRRGGARSQGLRGRARRDHQLIRAQTPSPDRGGICRPFPT